jgi:hypothetical protein
MGDVLCCSQSAGETVQTRPRMRAQELAVVSHLISFTGRFGAKLVPGYCQCMLLPLFVGLNSKIKIRTAGFFPTLLDGPKRCYHLISPVALSRIQYVYMLKKASLAIYAVIFWHVYQQHGPLISE